MNDRGKKKSFAYGPFLEAGLVILLTVLTAVLWLKPWRTEEVPMEEPTASPAQPTPIPPDMFEYREGEYVHVEYGGNNSNEIDESLLADPNTKTAADLAAWANMAWDNQWGYVWGTFGQVLTEDLWNLKLEQYPDDLAEYAEIVHQKWLNRRTVDCAGLIKSYGWYVPGEGIQYTSGDMPDWGTPGFFENAPDKGDIDTLPETPGLLVYVEGHIGVYVGNGMAVEAITHAGGVVKTRVVDRHWTHWLKCPYVEY